MANELDELMDRDPLDMTQEDLAAIVLYHRRQRVRITAGEKAVEAVGGNPKPAIDLKALGLVKEDTTFVRRA